MGLTRPRAYQIYDIDYKQAVRVVTTSNITLSGGAPNSVDGVSLTLKDRVLVTGQSTGNQNGIYYVTTLGTGSNGTWSRSIDTDATGELLSGTIVMVTEGNTYADTQWKLTTNDPITIGSTSLTFVQNYSTNSISAGTSNVVVTSNANVTISSAGAANVLTVTSTGANVAGTLTATGNVTGGNLITAGQVVATGTITSNGVTNSTAFAVGNSAVSNVALGFFPTAGTKGDYAIRDYSTVFSNMYFDVCIGGTPNGAFQFRSSSSYNQFANINSSGINTPLAVTATGIVSGLELTSTNSQVNEGGQINLALPSSGSTLSGSVIIDVYQNRIRFFEGSGTARGAYIDLTSCSAGAGTNLLAGGGGGGTPGGSNTYVQFNDASAFGGNAQFTYDKVTNTLTAGIIASTNNGLGTNFKVGDDIWIGDVNTADTMRLTGQQNGANAYIVFGNADGAQLGRAGTGPLTYAGAFTATGNVTGGNLITAGLVSAGTTITATGNVAGGNVTTGGNVVATGNVSGGNLAAVTNIYSFSTMQAVGNITGGNIVTAGKLVSTVATGTAPLTVSSTTVVTNLNADYLDGLHSASTNTVSTIVARDGSGNFAAGTITATLSGAATTAGTVTTAAQPNITSVGTLSSLSVTGNITSSTGYVGTIYTNSIINTGANGTGNIGSSSLYFNTAFVKATSAQYADLAEMYVADNNYTPGTVVEFGGEYEITITQQSHSTAVAGIISTDPSYLMNSTQAGEHVLPVALTGRVPCQVLGPVNKGDVLVSSHIPGVAQRIGINWQPGCVVGKSMEKISTNEVKTIEVAVGRL